MEVPAQEKRSVVASGKTVDDAIAHGLAMLGMRRDQVEIKVGVCIRSSPGIRAADKSGHNACICLARSSEAVNKVLVVKKFHGESAESLWIFQVGGASTMRFIRVG